MASPQHPIEFWTASHGVPGYAARRAQQLQAEGWSGIGIVDSQCLSGDVYVAAALAAAATDRLLVATAVTNPVTRHPATAAAAAATVQAESGGRFVLGIGRGDSALAHIGLAPATLAHFERHVERLQRYLRGEEVPFDDEAALPTGLRPVTDLGMASAPSASRLRWLGNDATKVPVDVAASGPRVIEIAARHADGVTFAVGVDPDRLGWAIDHARRCRAEAGLDPDTLRLGAYVPVSVDDDATRARELARGGVGSYARFSVMHGQVAGPIDEAKRETLQAVHGAYDMHAHFQHGSAQAQQLDDELIDAFAITGPVGHCVDRLAQLREMGITRFFVFGPGRGADAALARASHRRIAEEILPAMLDSRSG